MRTTGATGVRVGVLLIAFGLLALPVLNNQGPDTPAQTLMQKTAGVSNQGANAMSAVTFGPGKHVETHSVTVTRSSLQEQDAESAWGERFQTFPDRPLADDAMVGDYTIAEHRQFKEEYYCDLAVQAREQCEGLPDALAYQRCLSLRSYYTYGRHCEYLP